MSYIESSIRDALAKAAADTQSAQRGLALAAALLLLLHLLTVTPYVQVSSHLAGLEKDTAATMQLSEKLDAQKNQIEAAKKQASTDLGLTLNQATQEMIQSFAAVDDIIAGNSARIAVQGPSPRAYLPDSEHLTQLAAALRQGDSEAQKQLEQYARDNIVGPAYLKVNQAWNDRIRPALMVSIENAEKSLAEAKALSPSGLDLPKPDKSLTAVLSDTQAELAKTRAEIAKMELSPNGSVNKALGEEWWKSVAGKDRQANAVADQVQQQLKAVDLNAVAGSFAQLTAMQDQARTKLVEQQRVLAKDLEESQIDIASIAGSSAALPIHAKTLIGLFPLMLGLVLAVMVSRIAVCRGSAATAARNLAAESTDEKVRSWLMRRAEVSKLSLAVELIVLPLATVAWIAIAASQINSASAALNPPLPVWVSASVGAGAVLIAVCWNYANVRRLSIAGRQSQRLRQLH